MMRKWPVWILTLALLLTALSPTRTPVERVAEGPTLVMVPVPPGPDEQVDSVRLATDLYLPDGTGPWPTILVRTPYSRQSGGRPIAEFFNAAGFAVVVQDTRGRFDSEGTDRAFFTAAQDGHATLEWIAAQPWSDGRVGTWGPSALGIDQYLLAPDAPEALRCQMVLIATPDLYRHAVFPGGVLRQALVEGWLKAQRSEQLLQEWTAHPFEDSHWDAVDISNRYGEIHVPALHVGGWYDIFTQGTLDAFVGYQEQGGPGAAGRQYLLMGPWTHGRWETRRQGELAYPENAVLTNLEMLSLAADWFRACLLDDWETVAGWPAVRYYVMGDVDDPAAPGNEWREADAWPPPSTELALYLHADGTLDTAPPAANEPGDPLPYTAADPSPTVCGANLMLRAGPCDQRAIEARDDARVFSTAPLERPLEVTGRVRARLWLVSDAPDADLAVRLTDVYPDGRSMLVTDGILRASFRALDFAHAEPLTPGTPYELDIDVGSTSIVFNAGHRIRVIVTASNAPRFAPNATAPVATYTLLHDAAQPSALLLPVVAP